MDHMTSTNSPAATSTLDPVPAGSIAPPGLKGLIVASTRVGSVRGEEGWFHYRDHDAVQIARHHTFEAAATLLLDGALPDAPTESRFRAALAEARNVDLDLVAELHARARRSGANRMSVLRAALSLLVDDTPTIDLDASERRERLVRAIGAVPAVLAALHRLTQLLGKLHGFRNALESLAPGCASRG